MIDRKKLAKYIDKQNNKIDKAKSKGYEECKLIDIPEDDYKKEFIYYYTEMIGYKISDDKLYFKHIRFLQDDNLFPEFVIRKEK